MAIHNIGPNSKVYWDGYDITGDVREGTLNVDVETLDKTVWGDTTRKFRAGLYSISFNASGFAQHNSATPLIEDILSGDLAAKTAQNISVGTDTSAEGDVMFMISGVPNSLQPFGGAVGDLSGFVISAQGAGTSNGAVWYRGKLLATKANRTTSSNSTGVQLGTIAATDNMHATLHVFAYGGTSPTLDVTIESDDNSGFTSATTRMTFTQVGESITSETLGPTAGPGGSDDYWRVAWTIGGTGSPNYTFAVVFGHETHG